MKRKLFGVLNGRKLNIDNDPDNFEFVEILYVTIVILPLLLLAHFCLLIFQSVLIKT